MFSKKPIVTQTATVSPGPSAAQLALARLSNPYVAAGAAALLLLLSLATLIGVAGDPGAAAPTVRLSLAKVALTPPPGWREALVAEGGQPRTSEGVLQLSETPLAMFGPAQAVIALPGGGEAPMDPSGVALPPAPIAALMTPGPAGPLPVIAADGRTPAQAYARPFVSDGRPKVALVIGGLGLNAKATRDAIEGLPPQVTLSFVPYAEGLQGWIDLAREHGHEVLLETPMEPVDYPENDPGPYTLMAGAAPQETVKRMEWLMSRATGYFGLTNYLGSRFLASDQAVAIFTGALKQRGLAFIDDGAASTRGGGVPRASAVAVIDEQLSAESISQRLSALEAVAAQRGQALGAGFAYPVTLAQAQAWARSVESRGYQLAPASAVAAVR